MKNMHLVLALVMVAAATATAACGGDDGKDDSDGAGGGGGNVTAIRGADQGHHRVGADVVVHVRAATSLARKTKASHAVGRTVSLAVQNPQRDFV